ncbi:Uncharacterized conserved protein YeaO, DUF488 family [Geopseudomonas sagittaria]|uniref:Uncharacterized conserved protein YeaO, DUF488 family n=1 Tax=Geopseudomonas sagittaria TaxID=1135990 RepID=A0A1I5VTI9_9GAMM|nr:DUF488 family protein [Pseudomonas sagittaria]SFQ10597.1 Uncharacterized conserved protein YeaO, DUF488 family [Pseudomonas sagittaria]
MIVCKRVYQPAAPDDGYRVLVDRLWPRGCSKASLPLDEWLRELAPSDGVRQAFAHEPERFAAFRAAYRAELAAVPAFWQPLLERARRGTLTLLYAAHDEQFNNARVLAEFLDEQLAAPAGAAQGEFR